MKRDKTGWTQPPSKAISADEALPTVTAEQLALRHKAMQAAFGIFKGKNVFPDGLEYQLEVRAEWE
ncbi:CopG family transcriptional regulator [Duganella aceris]|uniref:CopG family transcriptional regulator n=1 Tax=Duganella aceris TaxID=2703883 RepID=A0ABX0FQ87_9BURK|nr:CopG family transcriptional regulator [Duganella aceris]NGZ86796.1 CopG family transcriptional regulator [Duganella aceris]